MERDPRKEKWTTAYRRLHDKDMTQDATFEFERKRSRPKRQAKLVVSSKKQHVDKRGCRAAVLCLLGKQPWWYRVESD
ncbi:probable ribosome biogenesis protein RLP24 [Tanacetum coccineum]|uniref:Probable ribosome biogenesis protein RLP24 n=1 Tax=Tanacetum coccineum TaxID=301880 RepID=A0ABQ5GTV8_9ASTR